MLITNKLIDWLKQFPDDTPIYTMELNTGTWQGIPDFEIWDKGKYLGYSKDGNNYMRYN